MEMLLKGQKGPVLVMCKPPDDNASHHMESPRISTCAIVYNEFLLRYPIFSKYPVIETSLTVQPVAAQRIQDLRIVAVPRDPPIVLCNWEKDCTSPVMPDGTPGRKNTDHSFEKLDFRCDRPVAYFVECVLNVRPCGLKGNTASLSRGRRAAERILWRDRRPRRTARSHSSPLRMNYGQYRQTSM